MNTGNPHLLATESPYKIKLFTRLGIPFQAIAAKLDETPRLGDDAQTTAQRLARAKAAALRTQAPNAWIWGGDQVCQGPSGLLGKPETPERAIAMLMALSGHSVWFMTAVALLGPDGSERMHCEQVRVQFRRLSRAEIERYVAVEKPLDTAGAFKVECRGISLFDAVESRDPTALEGLPLITLSRWAREIGLQVP